MKRNEQKWEPWCLPVNLFQFFQVRFNVFLLSLPEVRNSAFLFPVSKCSQERFCEPHFHPETLPLPLPLPKNIPPRWRSSSAHRWNLCPSPGLRLQPSGVFPWLYTRLYTPSPQLPDKAPISVKYTFLPWPGLTFIFSPQPTAKSSTVQMKLSCQRL